MRLFTDQPCIGAMELGYAGELLAGSFDVLNHVRFAIGQSP